ncbi:MAG: hypothetical protein II230_01060, partial [Clostridia bacterium]|nr:hypothetical protein [Clostridia bacterium]
YIRPLAEGRLRQVIEYIADHYCEDITSAGISEKFGYDHDDYGFTDKNTEETHISRNDLKNADIALLKQETIHKLQAMGFRVVDVQITKHSKQIQVPSGYGILGIKKQYKSTTVDYLRIYIHIEW